jgi:hypothetical protein
MLRIDVDGDDFPVDRPIATTPSPQQSLRQASPATTRSGPTACATPGATPSTATGDLYIADVGQNAWEEINFQPAASTGGENYGWRCYEGNADFSTGFCSDPNDLTFPFLVYGHFTSVAPTFRTGCSITGGIVYRGCAIPELDGTYWFADYCSGFIFSCRYDGSSLTDVLDRTAELDPAGSSINSIVSFGEDAYGEMYICDVGGEVFKMIPTTPVTPDCNGNNIPDSCDIELGVLADDNNDGVPDICQGACCDYTDYTCRITTAADCATAGGDYAGDGTTCGTNPCVCFGDMDCDGDVDFDDISLFVTSIGDDGTAWAAKYMDLYGTTPPCDFLNGDSDGDNDVDFDDITPFVVRLPATCP